MKPRGNGRCDMQPKGKNINYNKNAEGFYCSWGYSNGKSCTSDSQTTF